MTPSVHDAWWRLTTSPPRSLPDRLAVSVLHTAAGLYTAAAAARNAAYDCGWSRQIRLPRPVISVGNLSVGGTGKTPCVEWLVERLIATGRRPAVLSRGYGGRHADPYILQAQTARLLSDDRSIASNRELADEPQLLARHLANVSVVVGRRREQSGAAAIARLGADVLVLDDGFQYRRLARDCDIVLLSGRMPLSGWPLLPAGPMREPLASLRRAHVIIVTKADQSRDAVPALLERMRIINRAAVLATAAHEPAGVEDAAGGAAVAPKRVEGARVALVSSIGDPDGFEQTVRALGAESVGHQRYPDHHRYTGADWRDTMSWAGRLGAQALVTTEKDLIRLRPLVASASLPVWVARIRLRMLTGQEAIDARLDTLLAR